MECVPTSSFCPWFCEKVVILLVYSGVKLILHIADINYYCMYSYNTK